MRSSIVALLLMAIAAVSANGCGTVLNIVSKEPEEYGGSRKDPFLKPYAGGKELEVTEPQDIGLMIFFIADVGVTIAGDALTLPFVRWRRSKLGLDRPSDPPEEVRHPLAPPPTVYSPERADRMALEIKEVDLAARPIIMLPPPASTPKPPAQ